MCRHLLKNCIRRRVRAVWPTPGTAQIFNRVARRHHVQDVVLLTSGTAGKNNYFCQSGRHCHRHLDIQRHLVITAMGPTIVVVHQDGLNGNVGAAATGGPRIIQNIFGVKTVELHQPYHLPRAGQGRVRHIRRAKIVTQKIARRGRTGFGHDVIRHGILFHQFGLRQFVIVQTAHICDRQGKIYRRLRIRRKKIARLTGMFETPQSDVKRALDVGHIRTHVEQQTVAVRAGDLKTTGPRKGFYRRIILDRRTKPRGEFFRRQIVVKIRTGRVINFLEKFRQSGRIAQWQPDGQP